MGGQQDPEIASDVDLLRRHLDVAVPRAEDLVAELSGIPAPPPVRWAVIDRATWAATNIAGMSELIAPLAERVAQRLARAPLPARIAQRGLVSAEVGVLLGYVSRRVLGQYDVLVPDLGEDGHGSRPARVAPGASLYFVGQNIVETQRRHSFVPKDFTLWVAVHEVTHRFQFAGVPWLKPRFFDLVHRYLGSIDLDVGDFTGRLKSAVRRLAARAVPPEERNPIYLLASDEQRMLLDDIQALMAVVEGHGNHVMDSVGAGAIPTFERMRRVFEARRSQTNAVQRAINHVLGLEMKLRQYELGQAFCREVARWEGNAALARLWATPQNLPSLQELRDPASWLRRVA